MANLLRRVGVDVPEPVRRFFEGDLDSWLRVEEYEEGDTLVVKAEVPGIDPEQDVEITLTGDELHMDVRREEKSEHKSKHGYRSEFRYGTFSRTITLPSGVTAQELRASYNDGVLEVRIPIPEEPDSATRKIPITRG
jgi:HSP20 family protein